MAARVVYMVCVPADFRLVSNKQHIYQVSCWYQDLHNLRLDYNFYTAREINQSKPAKKLSSWEKRSSHKPIIEKTSASPLPLASCVKQSGSAKKEIPIVEDPIESINEYQPYKKDENDYSSQMGIDRTTKVLNTSERVREDIQSYNEISRGVFSKKVETPISSRQSSSHSDKSCKSSKSSTSEKRLEIPDFLSSQYAKSQAQDNLKHHPLPDTINDQFKTTMKEGFQNLSSPNSAVGYKPFVSPGPTQCSKLKVYRPKTAGNKLVISNEKCRPRSSRKKNIGPIDLAIYWDLLPSNSKDEPKRPAHIDGSKNSAGPSVFTVVKPKEETPPLSRHSGNGNKKQKQAWHCENPVNPSAVMDIINNNLEVLENEGKINKEFRDKLKENEGKNEDLERIRRNSKKYGRNSLSSDRCSQENKNPNIQDINEKKKKHEKDSIHSASSINTDKLEKHKHYRSSPDLSTIGVENSKSKQQMLFSRPCMACEVKSHQMPPSLRRPKSDYKMAFKAGIPNGPNRTDDSRPQTAPKPFAAPKIKTPFARRTYSINTLAPPFSLWPGTTGMDYPEHWRLASVYHHSYKPIEQRKKPLIQGVFQ